MVRYNQLVPRECAAQETLVQLRIYQDCLGGGRVAVPLPQVESQLQVARDFHPSTGHTAPTSVSQGKNVRAADLKFTFKEFQDDDRLYKSVTPLLLYIYLIKFMFLN